MKMFILLSSIILAISLALSLESDEFCKIIQPNCKKSQQNENSLTDSNVCKINKCQGSYSVQCSSIYCALSNDSCLKLIPNRDLIGKSRNPREYFRRLRILHAFISGFNECPKYK